MIHTTQGSVIKAYKTLNRLCEEKMPVRLAYSLFSMRKSTESFYSFQVEREQEIFKEYVNSMESEALTFKTDEHKEKFVKENDQPCPDGSECGYGIRTHSAVYEAGTQKTYYTKST